jgi:Mrp family chromosome partitioning ATPase
MKADPEFGQKVFELTEESQKKFQEAIRKRRERHLDDDLPVPQEGSATEDPEVEQNRLRELQNQLSACKNALTSAELMLETLQKDETGIESAKSACEKAAHGASVESSLPEVNKSNAAVNLTNAEVLSVAVKKLLSNINGAILVAKYNIGNIEKQIG